jgi:hypothetical protein
LKGKYYCEDLSVDRRIILEWILAKEGVDWTRLALGQGICQNDNEPYKAGNFFSSWASQELTCSFAINASTGWCLTATWAISPVSHKLGEESLQCLGPSMCDVHPVGIRPSANLTTDQLSKHHHSRVPQVSIPLLVKPVEFFNYYIGIILFQASLSKSGKICKIHSTAMEWSCNKMCSFMFCACLWCCVCTAHKEK